MPFKNLPVGPAALGVLAALTFLLLGFPTQCEAYLSPITKQHRNLELHLFGNFFGGGKKDAASSASSSNTAGSQAKTKVIGKYSNAQKPLEKISRTQNRDYEAEAKARAPKPKELADKQVKSFNFQKTNEFPNLYKGWIKSDGDQIAKQMCGSVKNAVKKGEQYMEVLFDPVPNLDEVAVGTAWNKKLRKEVAANLQVPDFATNRGAPATLEWSNIYWANRLVEGAGLKNVVALSISGEGTKGKYLPVLKNNMRLVSLPEAKKPAFAAGLADAGTQPQAVIILSACMEGHYKDAKAIGDRLGAPVIVLNAPYSYRYDIGGGGVFNLIYAMKRIPKGWVYRAYPKPFEAIIEGPNYEVFRASVFPQGKQPSLPEISKVSMAASAAKYGAGGNDRIWQNRL